MSMTNNRLTAEELQKLRQTDFSKKPGFVKAETVLAKEVGEVGTLQRAEFDAKARAWYYGEILRERRKELGMTQKELAELSGLTQSNICKIERGVCHPTIESLKKIADATGRKLSVQFTDFEEVIDHD